MKASEFAAQFRDDLRQLRIDGHKTLQINNIANFLEGKIPELEAAERDSHKVTVDFRVEHYKHELAANHTLLESVFDYGRYALNTALLINAGAAVSLLSYIGGMAKRTSASAEDASLAMLIYVIGVFFAGLAGSGAYCSQYFYTYKPDAKTGAYFHRATVVVMLLAYTSFLCGSLLAYGALKGTNH